MRRLKTTLIVGASLVLAVFLGLTGCSDHHRDAYYRDDYDRGPVVRYERYDNDRHEERHDDRHDGDHR